MPWTQREVIQLGLLLLCVPVQYYFTVSNKGSIDKRGLDAVFSFIKDIHEYKETWLKNINPMGFKIQWLQFISWFVINVLGIDENESEESPAIEVFEYRKKIGLVMKSNKVHLHRPKEVWYRIGQVVQHTTDGYKGVIIEWHFEQNSKQPYYVLLLDERDALQGPVIKRVSQDNIYLLSKTQIKSPYLKGFFVTYDGGQYIPRPWLQNLYPKD